MDKTAYDKFVSKKKTNKKKHTLKFSFRISVFFVLLLIVGIGTYLLSAGGMGTRCANSISCIKDLSGRFMPGLKGEFGGRKIDGPSFAASIALPKVLGEKTALEKHIFVDLSTQHLWSYEGGQLIFDFPVSTGKWYPTPTGDFNIWIKLRYTRMEGGNPAIGTYYNLPNVPYTMFFYNANYPKSIGYGLHGAYWHNNFGHPMSHGCVNISVENAATLYAWAQPQSTDDSTYAADTNPGTRVTIFGTTPVE